MPWTIGSGRRGVNPKQVPHRRTGPTFDMQMVCVDELVAPSVGFSHVFMSASNGPAEARAARIRYADRDPAVARRFVEEDDPALPHGSAVPSIDERGSLEGRHAEHVCSTRRGRASDSVRFKRDSKGGVTMSVAAQATQASPLAAVFERYHVGWETRNPDLIASLHSEDTMFWLHDGSEPVIGRDALRKHCVGLFASFRFTQEIVRLLYGHDHWIFEWTMILSLAEPNGSPFTARVEMLDVVTVNAQGEVTRKDVYMNGKQSQAAFARAGITR